MKKQPQTPLDQLTALCRRIRKLREAKEFKQEDIAHSLEISQKAYSKIETGATKLSVERLIEIANLLEVDVAELLKVNTKEVQTDSVDNFNEQRIKQLEEAVVSLRETFVK
jgi:transcriptional regulator with XRE-family HTH domain